MRAARGSVSSIVPEGLGQHRLSEALLEALALWVLSLLVSLFEDETRTLVVSAVHSFLLRSALDVM